ncbi:MAG TPA: hypothetical protein VMG12_34910 [Polyangiaceae bacterium]|nr:hypothetical protein [Polyangiaceae bacterium]
MGNTSSGFWRRCVSRLAIAAGALAGMLAPPARAQEIVGDLGTMPAVGGTQIFCGGARTYVARMPELAASYPGMILVSQQLFSLPPIVQRYVYAHECSHLMLGSDEVTVDCHTVRLGRDQGWLTPQSLSSVTQYLASNPGTWSHAPDSLREQRMWQCMQRR